MFDYKIATPQKIFDYVSEHLIKQGQRAVDNYNNCQYCSEQETSCAVGCLLPDSVYNPSLEGRVVQELPGYIEDKEFGVFLLNNMELLKELQNAHDSFFKDTDVLRKQLNVVATLFNLNTEVLKETK